jgi:hypothetical protein
MGTTIIAYFVSILLYFPMYPGPAPQTGWMQWILPFPNQDTCVEFLEREEEAMVVLTFKRFEGVPTVIKGIECLTYLEAYNKNQDLGHTAPFEEPKESIPFIVRPLDGVPSA